MIAGAYSNFLLEYEELNKLNAISISDTVTPGTNFLRTMGAAAMALKDNNSPGIGALSSAVANCAVLGARGNAGVLLAQIFRGMAKGLSGKYEATSSVFGRAFQYGILYAHRAAQDKKHEGPMIITARAAAKGAHLAVRAERPISEILAAAIASGQKALLEAEKKDGYVDAGAKALMVLLNGCQNGLDGNFVSPALMFSSSALQGDGGVPEPKNDVVAPYCLELVVHNTHAKMNDIRKCLNKYGKMVIIEKAGHDTKIRLHADRPSVIVEQIMGWGDSFDFQVCNMAEPHCLSPLGKSIAPFAVLAPTENSRSKMQLLQEKGATLLVAAADESLAVGNFISAMHSDAAKEYILLPNSPTMHLVAEQAQHLMPNRAAVVYAGSFSEQLAALEVYDANLSLAENCCRMEKVIARLRKETGSIL